MQGGVLGNMPVITRLHSAKVLSLQQAYESPDQDLLQVWTDKGWSPVLGIQREQARQPLVRVSNRENWLYVTEDARLLLAGGETIPAGQLRPGADLCVLPHPKCNFLDLPVPRNVEPRQLEFPGPGTFAEYEETWQDYINARDVRAAKQMFLNLRNNMRFYTTTIFTLVEAQAKLILGRKAGFTPYLHHAPTPTHLRFDTSYETCKEDFAPTFVADDHKTGKLHVVRAPEYSREDHAKLVREWYPSQFTVRTLPVHLGRALETGDNPLRSVYPRHLYIHNYEQDFVYSVTTTSGFFQAGVGGLAVGGP